MTRRLRGVKIVPKGVSIRAKLRWVVLTVVLLASCQDLFDFTPPEVHILLPLDSTGTHGSVLVRVKATDDHQVRMIETFINSQADTSVQGDSLRYVATLPETGWYRLTAQAFDRHGNSAKAEVRVHNVRINRAPEAPKSLRAWPGTASPRMVRASAVDPDGDSLHVRFNYHYHYDRSDTTSTGTWLGPVPSGGHVWDSFPPSNAIDMVSAQAQDVYGAVSAPYEWLRVYPGGSILPIWPYQTPDGDGFGFSPAVIQLGDATLVYAACDGANVFGFRCMGGRPVVTSGAPARAGAQCTGSPVLSGDGQRLYITYDDGVLYCLSAATLSSVSSFAPDTSRFDFTEPAVAGSELYAGREDGSLYCLTDDGAGLQLNWRFEAGYPVELSAAISRDGSRIFFGNDSGVFCLNPAGEALWYNAAGGGGRLFGLDPADGHAVFMSDSNLDEVAGSPVVSGDGTVFAAREDGTVLAGRGGSVLWTHELPSRFGSVSAVPCLAPDTTVILHTDDDWLVALRQVDGNEDWEYPVAVSEGRRFGSVTGSSPAIDPGGAGIYVGSNDDGFYGILVDEPAYMQGPPDAPWPKYQGGLANRGQAGGG